MDEDESGMVSDRWKPKCLVKPAELPVCPTEIQHTWEVGERNWNFWTAEHLLSPQEGLYSVDWITETSWEFEIDA